MTNKTLVAILFGYLFGFILGAISHEADMSRNCATKGVSSYWFSPIDCNKISLNQK